MSEFLTLLPPSEALAVWLEQFPKNNSSEIIESSNALERILTNPIGAPFSLPSFPRATVDGYVVRAQDTFGVSENLPGYFELVGEIKMGQLADVQLAPGQCALIHTGGMLPETADAVVMIEYTQQTSLAEIEISKPVGVGENVIQIGEDVSRGDIVLPAGKRLSPADIGGLMALGITSVEVFSPLKIGIISSGDEVVEPGVPLLPGQIYNINSYSLAALVSQVGSIPQLYGIIPDDLDSLLAAATQALAENDLVVLTAGSSVSVRDLTAQVINSLGSPGVIVHGVNIRPGKPTILGICDGKPVLGLPGNPVSALVIAQLFLLPSITRLQGQRPTPIPAQLSAKLSINLSSQSGREDWIPVSIEQLDGGWVANPIFGKSNLIFTLAKADGLVQIPANANGIASGENVTVYLT